MKKARRTGAQSAESARHERVRAAHSLETAEDYVEAIADVIAQQRECRVVDLTDRFGVSHVTVTRTVGRLERDGLVTRRRYGPIALTARGKLMARRARERHALVVRFLIAMGISENTAHTDAEGIEHHVSAETLAAFARVARRNG